MKKRLSVLFLAVLAFNIFASERTDFIKEVSRLFKYFYSAQKNEVIEFDTTSDNELIRKSYTVSFKEKKLNLKEEKIIDVINVSFNEFDAIRKRFSLFDKINPRINPEAYYNSDREVVKNLTYTENKTVYYYVPAKTLIEVYNYIEQSKNLGIKNQKVTLEAERLKYSWENYDTDVFIYLDKYGYKNVQVIDGDSYLLIDGPEPCYMYLLKDKDGKVCEEYFMDRAVYVPPTINFKASSTLKDKKYTYSTENLNHIFNDIRFPQKMIKNPVPWVEGVKGQGIGETIEFSNPPSSYGFYLVILNGYVDPLKPHLFRENSRIKKLKIETDTGYSEVIEFNDWVEFKIIDYPYKANKVKLTILEVYEGTKYADTCITAMYLLNTAWNK